LSGEGDLDDPVRTLRGVRPDRLRRIRLIQRDGVRDSRPDLPEVAAARHGRDDGRAASAGELGGERTNAAEHAVNQDRLPGDRPVTEDGPVCGNAGDAQARTKLVTDTRRQLHGLLVGHHGQLCGGAERAIRLRAVDHTR
jgi:hypothetical protein